MTNFNVFLLSLKFDCNLPYIYMVLAAEELRMQILFCLYYFTPAEREAYRPLGYERVYLPLYKVADTPFHIQRDDIMLTLRLYLNFHPLPRPTISSG